VLQALLTILAKIMLILAGISARPRCP